MFEGNFCEKLCLRSITKKLVYSSRDAFPQKFIDLFRKRLKITEIISSVENLTVNIFCFTKNLHEHLTNEKETKK